MTEASYVDWDDIEPVARKSSGGGGGGGKFLRLEANKTHTVRPVHKAVVFHKIFNWVGKRANTATVKEKTTIPSRHPDLKASRKFAILVFDRDDNNQLKILEFGSTVLEAFKYYKKMTKKEPGGNEGGDFTIQVNCPSGKKDRDTTYKVDFKERAEFTEEERETIRSQKKDFDLKEIYAALSDEEAEKVLFSTGEEGNSGGNSSRSEPSEDSEPVASNSGSGSDDDLGLNW